MTVAIVFTLIIALILFRAFVLHLRSTDLDNDQFVGLPREVKLAILKERVLETPSEKALCNLETFLKSEGIEVIPPTFVDLMIVDAPPAVQGNTSGNVMREATLETGAKVMIPLFIENNTKIRVDTRDGSYLERAK